MFGARLVLFGLVFIVSLAKADNPNCFSTSEARLIDRCIISTLEDGNFNFEALAQIDTRFNQKGYHQGIGIKSNTPPVNLISLQIEPNLRYSSNTNGGNPKKDLTVGGYTFTGQQKNVAKAGLLLGINTVVKASVPIPKVGDGRYFDLSTNLLTETSDQGHRLSSNNFNLCSKNHFVNWWYIDYCYLTHANTATLSSNSSQTNEVTLEKVFDPSSKGYSSIKLSFIQSDMPSFKQDKIRLSSALMKHNGTFISYAHTIGENVDGILSLKNSSVLLIQSDGLSLNLGYSESRGGLLMGFIRNDTTTSISLAKLLPGKAIIEAGVSQTKSSIDYFTQLSPFFSVRIPNMSLKLW